MAGTKKRQRIRVALRAAFGDLCYWCGQSMEFAELRAHHNNMPKMATIEHHLAKQKGDRNQIMYMRLTHKECNR